MHSLVYVVKPGSNDVMRLAINYIPLNDETVKEDTTGLRTVHDCLMRMVGADAYSRIDASDWFFQYPLDERDQYKTGLLTPWGTLVFTVLGMGMTNSGTHAQEAMDRILGPFLYTDAPSPAGTAYQDDAALRANDDPLDTVLDAFPSEAAAIRDAYEEAQTAWDATKSLAVPRMSPAPPPASIAAVEASTAVAPDTTDQPPQRALPRGAGPTTPDGRFAWYRAPSVFTTADFDADASAPGYEATVLPMGTAVDKMFSRCT